MKYHKLSATLSSVLSDYEEGGMALLMANAHPVPLSSGGAGGGAPVLHVFLRCNDNSKFGQMRSIKVHQTSGTVRTAQVPLDQFEKLSDRDDVFHITSAQMLHPLLDVAVPKVGATTFKATSGLTGNGVIVGIVDTGVDVNHPALAGRILSIWDQNIPGPGWGTTTYGSVLTGAAMVASRDMNGHGTHVAGIAGGNDATFTGLASKAEYVIVKTDFSNVGIADGVRYIFEEATKLGRPAVVNLSLGGHSDAHDGSDDLSAVIDSEIGPGRIVVAAAGNEGQDPIHAAATVAAGSFLNFPFSVVPNTSNSSPPWVVLNGWYSSTVGLEIAIRTSSGNLTASQPILTVGSPAKNYSFPNARINIVTPPSSVTLNGDVQFRVEIQPGPAGSVVQGGLWRLIIKNPTATPARVDVWSIVPQNSPDAAFHAPVESSDMKIGSPGCAAEVVTVAAYTTRNQWIDLGGSHRGVGLTLDDIADFSSPGPLRNGVNKPDVTAPGAMIVSCLSSASTPPSKDLIAPGFLVEAGTSMASPFIAGVVALLLERDPTLDPAKVKAILQANSVIPGSPTPPHTTFDTKWGHGLLDCSKL